MIFIGNALAVEKEMETYALGKWSAVVAGGDVCGDLVVESIKSKTPVDTETAQRSISYKKERVGQWMFKIFTYAEPLVNPKSGALSTDYMDCLEYSSPCPKGQHRIANMMFRKGSLESKDKMDNILASLF